MVGGAGKPAMSGTARDLSVRTITTTERDSIGVHVYIHVHCICVGLITGTKTGFQGITERKTVFQDFHHVFSP